MTQTNLIIGKEFPAKTIPLIQQARKSIDIIVFEWKWYPDQIGASIQRFNNEIINAAKKNKKVRAIMNSRKIIDILVNNKIQAKKIFSKHTLHTKLMIIDNEIAIIGSHNYTMNAFTINYEISIIIRNKEEVKRLTLYFKNLWQ